MRGFYRGQNLHWLQSCCKKVIMLGDVPEFDVDPVPSAYFQELRVWPLMTRVIGNSYAKQVGIISKESEALDERTELALRTAVDELSGVQYAKLHDLFCEESGCRFSQEARMLYFNEHHLSTDGADLAPIILQSRTKCFKALDEARRTLAFP